MTATGYVPGGSVAVEEPVTVDGTVALDATTLAALEQTTATVTNTDFPDAAAVAKLEAVRALLASTLTVSDGAGSLTVDGGVTATPPNATISTANSTSATLAAGATWTGTAEQILPYAQVNVQLWGRPNVAVSGDASDAKGSLFIEFGPDGSNWRISIPIVVRTLGIFIPYPLITVARWFRLRYVNDGGSSAMSILGTGETPGTPTTQTAFEVTTLLLPYSTKELARTLDQGITGSDPVSLVRAVLAGKDPDGDVFINLPASGDVTDNSTSTPLGANATFTGAWHSRAGYVGLTVTIKADQVSATDGVVIEHSDNASAVRSSKPYTFAGTDVANGSRFLTMALRSKYFRVKYTNGPIAQGSFFLETNLTTAAAEVLRSRAGAHIVDLDALPGAQVATTTIGTAAARVDLGNPGRKSIEVHYRASNSNNSFGYAGFTSGITSGNSRELALGESVVFDVTEAVTVYAAASTASQKFDITEVYG